MRVFPLAAVLALAAPAQPPARLTSTSDTPTFTAEARLVEIHAGVYDRRGRSVPGLARESFAVLDAGTPRQVEIFEPGEAPLTLAILLDVTGSMDSALPTLKIAANDLISQLRQGDSVAVFGFRDRLETVQDFTTDHKAAMLAVRRIRTEGRTALFDATARVSAITARQKGRKAIVVFTDGEDNASTLTRQRAMEAAKRHGIPCYLIAQGEALKSKRLIQTLEQMASDTGGDSFRVNKVKDIAEVFTAISRDLKSTYLLAFRAHAEERKWYPLAVSIRDRKDLKVRCREGYYLD